MASAGGRRHSHQWCEKETILSSIYSFTHLKATDDQTYPEVFCSIFQAFVSALDVIENTTSPTPEASFGDGGITWPTLTCSDVSLLKSTADYLVKSENNVLWFPEYGCALVPLHCPAGGNTIRLSDDVPLILVGLDNWKFETHSMAQSKTQHTAACGGSSIIHARSVLSSHYASLIKVLQRLLQKAQAKKGEERSAKNGQGHQKTPAFIHALLCDALDFIESNSAWTEDGEIEVEEPHKPRGGFTDVGLHTGGIARNTAWPLVEQVIKVLLEHDGRAADCSEDLFSHVLAHFHLWLTTRQVALVTPNTATPLMLNVCMLMLKIATQHGAALAEKCFSMLHFEVACQSLRQKLNDVATQRAQSAAEALALQNITSTITPSTYRRPRGEIPETTTAPDPVADVEATAERASNNINSYPILLWSDTFADVLEFLQHDRLKNPATTHAVKSQYIMNSVERVLFRYAIHKLNDPACIEKLNIEDVDALVKIVEIYRTTVNAFLKDQKMSAPRMRIDLISREALIACIAYCIIDALTSKTYKDIMANYGVGLQWKELQYLVLGDPAAYDALLEVADYLQSSATRKPLFILRNPGPTFELAEQYAASDAHIQKIWSAEQRAAQVRKGKHWKKVQKQQSKLQMNREKLAEKKKSLSEWEQAYNDAHYRSKEQTEASKSVVRLRREIGELQPKIESWGRPPDPVIQPLPQQQHLAYRWLFFLYMPPLFRHLSRMSFLTQQLLLPRNLSKLERFPYVFDLVHHYNNQQSSTYNDGSVVENSGSIGAVTFFSSSVVPANHQINLRHIDHFSDPDQGVWHPDELPLQMGWNGSGSAADVYTGRFNPFMTISKAHKVEFFTEKLPDAAAELQWALACHGDDTAAERSNIAIVRQDQRPDWISKPGYLEFGAVRAYPLLQLRKLCVALHNRSLPLDRPEVHILIRQTLYHLGDIVVDGKKHYVASVWREEWDDEKSDLLPTLCCEIQRLADDLENMPRSYECVAILAELAAFLSGWYSPFLPISRRFPVMAARWADDLECNVADAGTESSKHARARQCLFRMLSLMCYEHGVLDAEDNEQMLTLTALIEYGRVFEDDNDPLLLQIESMHIRCRHVVTRRFDTIVDFLEIDTSILTRIVRLLLPHAPTDLDWSRWGWRDSNNKFLRNASTYSADGSDGHHYAINFLTGVVLYDGWPHRRLPEEIMGHSVYQRTFGDWNFEVSRSGSIYTTSRPVRGRFYEFYLADNKTAAGSGGGNGDSIKEQMLIITERDEEGNELELLDVGVNNCCGRWGGELPLRLKELYSHWLNRKEHLIVLRHKSFLEHDTHFIIQWSPPEDCVSVVIAVKDDEKAEIKLELKPSQVPVDFRCRRVPSHLRSLHWSDLLKHHNMMLNDELVLHSSSLISVLAKFEPPAFIHCYVNADNTDNNSQEQEQGVMLIELPRYDLEFEVTVSGIQSLDFQGYKLATCQQLVPPLLTSYTLPDFQQYLILEKHASQTATTLIKQQASNLVLIPAGRVQAHTQTNGLGSAGVVINVSFSSGAHLEVHKFEIHGRFLDIRATSILPRLQLAALYAATGSLLPEPGSRMTGAQKALQLLRQCWTTRPLSDSELKQLRDVGALGRHMAAGLPLVALELFLSSTQLNELHFPYDPPERCSGAQPPLVFNEDDATAYLLEQNHQKNQNGSTCRGNVRLKLTGSEEERVLGCRRVVASRPDWLRAGNLRHYEEINVQTCTIDANVIKVIEESLCSLARTANDTGSAATFGGGGSDGEKGLEVQVPGEKLKGLAVSGRKISKVVLKQRNESLEKKAQNCESNEQQQPNVEYPLLSSAATQLEREMHAELAESWITHCLHTTDEFVDLDEVEQVVEASRKQIKDLCCKAFHYLEQNLTSIPVVVGPPATAYRLTRIADDIPTCNALDLVKLAIEPGTAQNFNPFLSQQSVTRLADAAHVWLQLCVLQDRLNRISELLAVLKLDASEERVGTQALLLRELKVRRIWEVETHPEWLVFEAEGRLQIRPAQCVIAQYLMENPGAIVQLNMGEGKTRIIMPILVLHWAKQGKALVRLNFLAALMDEAYEYLHLYLCASVLQRKLFVQPFQRDIIVTPKLLSAMKASLTYCQRVDGVLLVAPEHRLSLMLKRHELWLQGRHDFCALLDAISHKPGYIDILDESDELLHHRFQLIYAWGKQCNLPALQSRARAAQALLQIVSRFAKTQNGTLGSAADALVVPVDCSDKPGAFSGLRLLPGDALQAALPAIHAEMAEAMFQAPPYEMRWMKDHPSKDLLLKIITEPVLDAQLELIKVDLTDKERCDILALRGFLACSLLVHNLQMRHRVDYGVSRLSSARKRLAVPFRAAHTPAERSEYAQPDSAILLTTLAYYADGLSAQEMLEALKVLLRLGLSAQQSHYNEWLAEAGAENVQEHLASASKIDTSNKLQMEEMHELFSHNMATIDFWLNSCVFPVEMKQFPKRLLSSAWHLAGGNNDSGNGPSVNDGTAASTADFTKLPKQEHETTKNNILVGFSGTNDNYRLLPLQVSQHIMKEHGLNATNGKMLDIILQQPQYYTLLVKAKQTTWEAVLELAVGKKMDALLDCGALLSGVSNRDAAAFIIKQLVNQRPVVDALQGIPEANNISKLHSSTTTQRFQGVCYFDSADKCWTVMDLTGRRRARKGSRISEHSAFTLYDEARCRGADLQLRQTATGMLTLGPGIAKDKLMQAAGRLRQLGRGQGVVFVGTADITEQIRKVQREDNSKTTTNATEEINSRHVLQWVMNNTVQATLKGILEWSKQGLHYAKTTETNNFATSDGNTTAIAAITKDKLLVDEVLDLAEMYGSSRATQPVGAVVSRIATAAKDSCNSSSQEIVQVIQQRSLVYGAGYDVSALGGLHEEVERELEREQEEEEEVEKEIPRLPAREEIEWDYTRVLIASSVEQLLDVVHAWPLMGAAALLQPESLRTIPWNEKVFCTTNFLISADDSSFENGSFMHLNNEFGLNEYLRVVDSFLLLPGDTSILFLSEREANGVLKVMLANKKSEEYTAKNGGAILMHLCYACDAAAEVSDAIQQANFTLLPQSSIKLAVSGGTGGNSTQYSTLWNDCYLKPFVSAQVFNGETTYVDPKGRQWIELESLPWLKELQRVMWHKAEVAEELVTMRGTQVLYSRSQLEMACGET